MEQAYPDNQYEDLYDLVAYTRILRKPFQLVWPVATIRQNVAHLLSKNP